MQSWKTIAVLCTVFGTCYCPDVYKLIEQVKNRTEVIDSVKNFFPDLSDLETKCRLQTNGEAAFDRIKVEKNKFTQSALDPIKKWTRKYPELWNETTYDFSEIFVTIPYCMGFWLLKMELRPLLDATLECLTPTERKNLNSIRNAAFAGAEYACFLGGMRVFLIHQTGFEECVKYREVGLAKCEEKLKHFTKNETEEILEFNSQNCKVLSDASSCVVEELKQCNYDYEKPAAEVIGQFFGAVLKKLHCDFHAGNSLEYDMSMISLLWSIFSDSA